VPLTEFRQPLGIELCRWAFKPVFRGLFRVLARVRVTGLENVPSHGPYVIAINHISLYDPPLALAFWPAMAEAVGAADVFRKKFQGPLLRLYGIIPVHREAYDRRLLDTVFAILRAGRPLLIAPEGGRSHATGMRRAMPGVGYVFERALVPVLPVGIFGTTADFWQRARRGERPLLQMRVGQPVAFPPLTGIGADRRVRRQQDADLVMRHIAGLLPAEYHGVYAGQAIYQPP